MYGHNDYNKTETVCVCVCVYRVKLQPLKETRKVEPMIPVMAYSHVPLCYGQLRLFDIEFTFDYNFRLYHGRKLQTASNNMSVSYLHNF